MKREWNWIKGELPLLKVAFHIAHTPIFIIYKQEQQKYIDHVLSLVCILNVM